MKVKLWAIRNNKTYRFFKFEGVPVFATTKKKVAYWSLITFNQSPKDYTPVKVLIDIGEIK